MGHNPNMVKPKPLADAIKTPECIAESDSLHQIGVFTPLLNGIRFQYIHKNAQKSRLPVSQSDLLPLHHHGHRGLHEPQWPVSVGRPGSPVSEPHLHRPDHPDPLSRHVRQCRHTVLPIDQQTGHPSDQVDAESPGFSWMPHPGHLRISVHRCHAAVRIGPLDDDLDRDVVRACAQMDGTWLSRSPTVQDRILS